MRAIDVHGHFGVYDRGDSGAPDRMRTGSIDVVRARAAAAGIVITVVSSLTAFTPYGGNVLRGNEESRRAREQSPDVRFWAVLDPRLKESFAQVRDMLTHPSCKGIKLHPTEHCWEIRVRGDEVFDFAEGKTRVLISHSGNQGAFPEDFVPFANRHPELSLILAHLGNGQDGHMSHQVFAIQQAVAGNVYVDTSSAASISSGLIEWAVGEVGAGRLMLGTDTPLYFSPAQKARIELAEIDEPARRAILYDNAARLLGEAQ